MSGLNGTPLAIEILSATVPVTLPGSVTIEMDLTEVQRDLDVVREGCVGKSRWQYLEAVRTYFEGKFPDHKAAFAALGLIDRLDYKLFEGYLTLKKTLAAPIETMWPSRSSTN
jgi:hypothetical protein